MNDDNPGLPPHFFDLSLDLLVVAGFDGYFKRLNPSWTRTFGWTMEEFFAVPSVEFVHPDDREKTLAARARLKDGIPASGLVNRYRCKDGSYRWLQWMSVSYRDRGLVYAVARDITAERQGAEEREKLQQQLIFSDRMASVGRLAAGVAHEINNPLSFVMTNLRLAITQVGELAPVTPDVRDELTEMLGEALVGAERVAKIVRDLKTFSRAPREQNGVIALEPALELSLSMVANDIRHRARLVKDLRPTPLIEGDEARLMQVFTNLLINAAQAIPEGHAQANEIRVRTFTDGGKAVIEIEDTGPGIPPDVLPLIFDPFFTTKPLGMGTGLGLSISQTLVTGMGGDITAASEGGRGARFRVTFPAAPAAHPESTALRVAPPSPPPVERPARILIVDDEPAVGVALKRTLPGHDVTLVTRAREALEFLRSGEQFDLIMTDLMMPEGSGIELYEELAQAFPELVPRVIFVTGGAFTSQARAFLERVPNPRIEKPFDPRYVEELIRQLVR